MWGEVAFIVAAYLFGSLPIVYLIGRLRGVDIRQVGSGNVGAGNLWLNVGPLGGMLGGLADVSKGFLPMVLARYLGLDAWVATFAGLAGIAAQMWPITLGFKGGRGNSASLGAALALAPRELLVAAIPMVVGGALRNASVLWGQNSSLSQRLYFRGPMTRAVPLGMLTGFATLPMVSWLLQEDATVTVGCLGILLLTVLRRTVAGLASDKALCSTWSGFVKAMFSRLLYDRHRP